MTMTKKYNADSIEHLSFTDGVRKRVGMYLGSADMQGVLQGLLEIVNNSVDEAIMGHGNQIIITVSSDSYSIEDFGRGIPVGPNKTSKDVLVDMLTSAHSGAKFSSSDYTKVRGLNGVGMSATAASSDYFKVVSKRDGYIWELEMKDGLPTSSQSQKKEASTKTGTKVYCTPAASVFSEEPIKINFNEVSELVKEYAYFSPQCKFIVVNEETKERKVFHFKNGMKDFAKDIITDPIHKNIIYFSGEDNDVEYELILQWTKGKERIYTFVNGGSSPEGGTPVTGLKTALTTRINSLLDKKIDGDVIRRGLVAVISIKHPNPVFANQTKTKINNAELRGLISQAALKGLEEFERQYKKEYDTLLEYIVKSDKAERAALRAREAVLAAEKDVSTPVKKAINLPEKAVDATNKTGYREILLTEGDSASSFLKATRDSGTQAVMPLRGKILNTYDLEFHEAYENQEVRDIFTLLGCGAGRAFNLKKLRYEKVIIAADGDEDGGHITLLLVALFLEHSPELLKQGLVYRVIPPFYRYKEKYFFSDEELNSFLEKHPNVEYERYKGLGAMSEDEVSKYIMGSDRKLVQIKFDDIPAAKEMFDIFLGKDTVRRKQLVEEGEWLYD